MAALKYEIKAAVFFLKNKNTGGVLKSPFFKDTAVSGRYRRVLFLFPILLPITEVNPLFRLVGLLPIYHVLAISLLSVEQMSNGMLYAIWAIPAALLLLGVGASISRRAFAKHQVL